MPAPRPLPRPCARARRAAVIPLLLATVAACSRVDVEAAPFADDPACAQVMARLPDRVADGLDRRTATGVATAAWGDPPVVLRCGVVPPKPTGTPCVRVADVDWVAEETRSGWTFTAYGRVPGVEVRVPAGTEPPERPLVDLAAPVAALPQQRACV